jgi:predicted metal-binding membrane protein
MRQSITYAEGTLGRDRLMVLAGLVSISTLAWAYLIYLTVEMGTMEMAMEMSASMQPWTTMDLVLRLVMWAVMMIAMMVPTATAMILAFATINRRRHMRAQPYTPDGDLSGRVCGGVDGLQCPGHLRPVGVARGCAPVTHDGEYESDPRRLLAPHRGGYQWTPLKYACLKHCRSPLGFLLTDWREGLRGALIMGLRHGLYCTGCCWFLMALLFVAGVMNFLWVATISLFVLVEKVVPRGDIVGRVAGGVLAIAGLVLLGHGFG